MNVLEEIDLTVVVDDVSDEERVSPLSLTPKQFKRSSDLIDSRSTLAYLFAIEVLMTDKADHYLRNLDSLAHPGQDKCHVGNCHASAYILWQQFPFCYDCLMKVSIFKFLPTQPIEPRKLIYLFNASHAGIKIPAILFQTSSGFDPLIVTDLALSWMQEQQRQITKSNYNRFALHCEEFQLELLTVSEHSRLCYVHFDADNYFQLKSTFSSDVI